MSENSDWDPDVSGMLHEAFDRRDIDFVEKYLQQHPQYRQNRDGSDKWLLHAASDCWLEGVQRLVKAGVDINSPFDVSLKGSKNYLPHTAICTAAGEGCAEVVEWMLTNGAEVNYEREEGIPVSVALFEAVRNGHLEIVKLLVEHGAEFQAAWNHCNPTMLADKLAHAEVRDYLKSIGGVDLRDETPRNFEAAHAAIDREMQELFRKPLSWQREIGGLPRPVFMKAITRKKAKVLYTVGLSDYDLPGNGHLLWFFELLQVIPADWDLENPNPGCRWAIQEMERIVRHFIESGRWEDKQAVPTEPLGDMPAPFPLWRIYKLNEGVMHLPDCRFVSFHEMTQGFVDPSFESMQRRRVTHALYCTRYSNIFG